MADRREPSSCCWGSCHRFLPGTRIDKAMTESPARRSGPKSRPESADARVGRFGLRLDKAPAYSGSRAFTLMSTRAGSASRRWPIKNLHGQEMISRMADRPEQRGRAASGFPSRMTVWRGHRVRPHLGRLRRQMEVDQRPHQVLPAVTALSVGLPRMAHTDRPTSKDPHMPVARAGRGQRLSRIRRPNCAVQSAGRRTHRRCRPFLTFYRPVPAPIKNR